MCSSLNWPENNPSTCKRAFVDSLCAMEAHVESFHIHNWLAVTWMHNYAQSTVYIYIEINAITHWIRFECGHARLYKMYRWYEQILWIINQVNSKDSKQTISPWHVDVLSFIKFRNSIHTWCWAYNHIIYRCEFT